MLDSVSSPLIPLSLPSPQLLPALPYLVCAHSGGERPPRAEEVRPVSGVESCCLQGPSLLSVLTRRGEGVQPSIRASALEQDGRRAAQRKPCSEELVVMDVTLPQRSLSAEGRPVGSKSPLLPADAPLLVSPLTRTSSHVSSVFQHMR